MAKPPTDAPTEAEILRGQVAVLEADNRSLSGALRDTQNALTARAKKPRVVDLNNIFERPYGVPAPVNTIAADAKPRQRTTKNGEIILRPVHPNVGIASGYRKKIEKLVAEMADSFDYWLKASYKKNEPIIAQDATPARELQDAIEKLARQWQHRFDEAAPELARYFAKSAYRRNTDELMAILKRGGFTVQFKMTPAMRDIFRATVEANVQLIKSIPSEYLTQVQGSVMRSVQTGRDLGALAKDLEDHYGVSKRRAAFIARSQNNLATSSMTAARQVEVGVKKATWLHSHGGKEPRRTHVANSGKPYDPAKGWYDPEAYKLRGGGFRGEWILPGQLPNCRCVSASIIKGFS
jgi:Phage Mu protein F like protein